MFGRIKEWPAVGVEIAVDRAQTWVARAARLDEIQVVVELLDPVPGTTAVVGLLGSWSTGWKATAIGVDPRSPSATLVDPLQQALPTLVRTADARALAVAHGSFEDLLNGGQLKIRGHRAVDDAARLAASRRLAGAHALDRYAAGSADSAPLVACELAVWALLTIPPWTMPLVAWGPRSAAGPDDSKEERDFIDKVNPRPPARPSRETRSVRDEAEALLRKLKEDTS